MRHSGSPDVTSKELSKPEVYAVQQLPTDLSNNIPYASSQYVNLLSATSSSESNRQYLQPSESGNHPFLDLVTLNLSLCVALERLKITINMWEKGQIHKLLHHNDRFWTKYLGAPDHRIHHHLVQKILIINFLAGTNFRYLRKSDDGSTYIHRCRGENFNLNTIEEMIDHIESEHHIHPLTLQYKMGELTPELQGTLKSVD